MTLSSSALVLNCTHRKLIIIGRFYNGSTYNYDELWQGIRHSDCLRPCRSTKVCTYACILSESFTDPFNHLLNLDFSTIFEHSQHHRSTIFTTDDDYKSEGHHHRVLHPWLLDCNILRWPGGLPRSLARNGCCSDSRRCSTALRLDKVIKQIKGKH